MAATEGAAARDRKSLKFQVCPMAADRRGKALFTVAAV
jgi:hypothetical protein